MPARVSRTKLAQAVTEKLIEGDAQALKQLAAYLVQTRRTGEAELIVRDIEAELASRGTVLARVASPRALSSELKAQVTDLARQEYGTKASVVIAHEIDESLLAGMKVRFPGTQIDLSAKAKLELLTVSQ